MQSNIRITQNVTFDDTQIVDDQKKIILDGVTNMDLKCSTDLHNIGNTIVQLGTNITSFQTKLFLIDGDTTLTQNEKVRQKSIVTNNFINNQEVYNNVKAIVDKITTLNFEQIRCITNKDASYICAINTDSVNFASFDSALTKYKTVITKLLTWIVALLDERQKYCGYDTESNAKMRQFYTNALNIINPYIDYYRYLYSIIGFGLGLMIGMAMMYLFLRKKTK